MGFSTAVALGSIGLTWVLWGGGKDKLRDIIEEKAPALHRVLWNKWYVDDLYEMTLIGPTVAFSKNVLWRIVDEVVVDGLVNGVASPCPTLRASSRVRLDPASTPTGRVVVVHEACAPHGAHRG